MLSSERSEQEDRIPLTFTLDEEHPEYLKQLGETLLTTTREICCIGSWNKRANLAAAKQFDFLLKAVTVIILGTLEENAKQRLNNFLNLRGSRRIKNRFKQLTTEAQEKGVVITVRKPSVGKYFQPGQKQAQLPLNYYCDIDLLKIVYACFPPPVYKWRWSEEMVNDLKPYLANYLSEYLYNFSKKSSSTEEALLKSLDILRGKLFQEENQFLEIFEGGKEFASEKHQKLFIRQTIRDVKATPALFGVGNCALMADCAFLAALSLKLPQQLTYIRCVSSVPNVDVINAIAIGNWPDPGCLIVCPWQGPAGRHYEWQGEIEKTPQIKNFGPYDEVKVLIRVDPTSSEAESFRTMLSDQGFSSWLTLPNRKENLDAIHEFIPMFGKALEGANFISKTLEKIEPKLT